MIRINSLCSVHEAIEVRKEILVLCGEDFHRVRDQLPVLYLRIGSDAAVLECHEFLLA